MGWTCRRANRQSDRRQVNELKSREFTPQNSMTPSFLDYYRCPEEFARFGVAQELGQTPGFFRFGKQITCFGRSAGPVAQVLNGDLPDALPLMQSRGDEIILPFDTDEILENLRKERYVATDGASSFPKKLIRKSY